ncbi:hypothetical protein GCM10012286_66660 [Streptomyces lasiicapitis]|uniref:Uncharacterized protein n=1 Tax=Streptomyces lasiicapitis TaxID=1923961 RepID=A0ABQ2MNC5_9ACTN|nr:hypothetical protein GCM10012286_66660 [Streptomyces lasiicapitis]
MSRVHARVHGSGGWGGALVVLRYREQVGHCGDACHRTRVRESSSQPLTPKGTAALLSCPGPARNLPGAFPAPSGTRYEARTRPHRGRTAFTGACMSRARMAMAAAPYRRFAPGSGARSLQASDRPVGHALNP